MQFFPFEVTPPHVIYACLGGFIVLFGMFSLVLRSRLYVGEACWAFLFGVIIGPYCAGIFDPRSWGDGDEGTTDTVTLEFTRVVLAIGVFAIGVELPKAYMARHWKSLFFLLVPVMTWGWFVSAGLIYAFIPGLNFLSSLAVAACLTPTDPILAAAVVGGKWADKHVPAHIRHLLAAESGCNDGAAFPFLFIALYLLLGHGNTGHAIRDWFLLLWLYQVIVGIVIGGLLGFAFRHLMKFCERFDLIDRHSYVAQYVSLAIFTIGVCTLLGSDDLLAAFACGTAFAWDGFFNRQTEESVFSSVIDLLFNIAAFVFVGAWMPFSSFNDEELTLSVWRLIVIAVLVLILRRLPVMIALYKWIPDVKTFRESLFVGHFGPIGIGAVFISTLAVQVIHHRHTEGEGDHQIEMLTRTIQPIVAFMVLCSITIHGLSIPSISLGRRVHSVSRTWSRRETIDEANPDWTNQITRITKPDDVVINRDHADLEIARKERAGKDNLDKMEKGEFDSKTSSPEIKSEREKQRRDTDEGSAETKVALGNSSARASSFTETDAIDRGEGEHLDARRRLAGDYREETPPDGEGDDYVEWIEGDDTIIERRQGVGGDVQVEVETRHRDLPPMEKGFSFQGMKQSARNAEERLKARLSPRPSLPENPSSSATTPDYEKTISSPAIIVGGDEDETEWASENENNEPIAGPSSISQTAKSEKKRPRVFGRKQRHKLSLRRGDSRVHENQEPRGRTGHGTTFPSTSPSISASGPAIGSGGHGYGHKRADSVPTPQITITTPGGVGASRSGHGRHGHGHGTRPRTADSARNTRLESIRAQASRPPTREVSPSRSVRFVDEALSPTLFDFASANGGHGLSPRPSRIWGSSGSGSGDVTPGTRTPERRGSGTLTPKSNDLRNSNQGLESHGSPAGSR